MKYKLGSLTIEAIDTYVRVTVENFGGADCSSKIACTKNECPTALEVAALIQSIRGYWPDRAVLQACGHAARDARLNYEGKRIAI